MDERTRRFEYKTMKIDKYFHLYGDKDSVHFDEIDAPDDTKLYIKIYADSEPNEIAEKVYQISDDKLLDIIECLKEYAD